LLDGRADQQDALVRLTSAAGRRRTIALTRDVAAKIAAAKRLTIGGVALAATGGVAATAASVGQLPNPLPHSGHAMKLAVAASGHG
jgi:hypothetical protein